MKPMNLERVVRNIDRRLERVEQILPTLPTREEMHAALNAAIRGAVAPLATREELEQKLAAFATKEELDQKLAALATREELDRKIASLATKDDLREEAERSRRHTLVLFESLMDRINIVADGFATTQSKIDEDISPKLADHDRRITALEDARGRVGGGRKPPS